MIRDVIQRSRSWLREPATIRHQLGGVFVGAFAGFWFGMLGWAVFEGNDALDSGFLPWALAGLAVCAAIGLRWPKPVLVVLFPLTQL